MYPKSLEVPAVSYPPGFKSIKVINELLRQLHRSPSLDAFRVGV